MSRGPYKKTHTHTCKWCGIKYQGTARGRFCSNRCKQAGKNAVNRGTHKNCASCTKVFQFTHGLQKKCEDCRG